MPPEISQKRCCKAVFDDPNRKKNAFLKNKAGELLKTNDEPKKQTENKAETKLAKLLKKIETPIKQSENKPENKAGHLVENTRPSKTNRKQTRAWRQARSWLASEVPLSLPFTS
ncbi:MAG: hypothetical protein P8Z30_19940 [Acidobacteriota bacterium]